MLEMDLMLERIRDAHDGAEGDVKAALLELLEGDPECKSLRRTAEELFLFSLGVFFNNYRECKTEGVFIKGGEKDLSGQWGYWLNVNDTFGPCADAEFVLPADVPEIARLCRNYGYDGAIYWVARKRGRDPAFKGNEIPVQFIRQQETKREQKAAARAEYLKGKAQ